MPSEYNPQLIENMSAKFRRLNNPAHAMADAVALGQSLPGLVGFWPGAIGINSDANALVDFSHSGIHMTGAGSTVENVVSTSLARYLTLDGSTGYYSFADSAFTSFGLTGAMGSTQGFTILCWIRPTGGAGSYRVVASKYTVSGSQGAFILQRIDTNYGRLSVSANGSTFTTVQTISTIANDEWKFLAARWTPSTEMIIWEGSSGSSGLVPNTNTTSIPATMFDSTASLAIGASNITTTPSNFWYGDVSLVAICRKAVPTIFIDTYYQMTAPLFNVTV